MRRLIILVTGLAKPHGRRQARPGLPETYEELSDMDIPDTKVVLFRWGTVNEIVKLILEYDPDYILSGVHSYGGSTMLMVAQSLFQKHNQDKDKVKLYQIHDLVCMDVVWREKIDSPQFKSLFHPEKRKLVAPYNVKRLWIYFQTKGIIKGHGWKWNKDYTEVKEIAELKGYSHQKFDRSPEPNKVLRQLAVEGKP